MIYETISELRRTASMTQAELARRLDVSRSSVNAWEMGISTPSVQNIVELASIFHVSTDTILGVNSAYNLDISDLTQEQKKLVIDLVGHFYSENSKNIQ